MPPHNRLTTLNSLSICLVMKCDNASETVLQLSEYGMEFSCNVYVNVYHGGVITDAERTELRGGCKEGADGHADAGTTGVEQASTQGEQAQWTGTEQEWTGGGGGGMAGAAGDGSGADTGLDGAVLNSGVVGVDSGGEVGMTRLKVARVEVEAGGTTAGGEAVVAALAPVAETGQSWLLEECRLTEAFDPALTVGTPVAETAQSAAGFVGGQECAVEDTTDHRCSGMCLGMGPLYPSFHNAKTHSIYVKDTWLGLVCYTAHPTEAAPVIGGKLCMGVGMDHKPIVVGAGAFAPPNRSSGMVDGNMVGCSGSCSGLVDGGRVGSNASVVDRRYGVLPLFGSHLSLNHGSGDGSGVGMDGAPHGSNTIAMGMGCSGSGSGSGSGMGVSGREGPSARVVGSYHSELHAQRRHVNNNQRLGVGRGVGTFGAPHGSNTIAKGKGGSGSGSGSGGGMGGGGRAGSRAMVVDSCYGALPPFGSRHSLDQSSGVGGGVGMDGSPHGNNTIAMGLGASTIASNNDDDSEGGSGIGRGMGVDGRARDYDGDNSSDSDSSNKVGRWGIERDNSALWDGYHYSAEVHGDGRGEWHGVEVATMWLRGEEVHAHHKPKEAEHNASKRSEHDQEWLLLLSLLLLPNLWCTTGQSTGNRRPHYSRPHNTLVKLGWTTLLMMCCYPPMASACDADEGEGPAFRDYDRGPSFIGDPLAQWLAAQYFTVATTNTQGHLLSSLAELLEHSANFAYDIVCVTETGSRFHNTKSKETQDAKRDHGYSTYAMPAPNHDHTTGGIAFCVSDRLRPLVMELVKFPASRYCALHLAGKCGKRIVLVGMHGHPSPLRPAIRDEATTCRETGRPSIPCLHG